MTAGAHPGWRMAGLVALSLLLAAVTATIAFPIVAGILKLGMAPGVTGLTALSSWAGFTLGDKTQPAHWFVFWTHLRFYLNGAYAAYPGSGERMVGNVR